MCGELANPRIEIIHLTSLSIFFIFKGLNSSPNGCEWEQVTTVFDFPLLEKVDCVRSDEASENCFAVALSSAPWLDEVLVCCHPIYRNRTFLIVAFIGVRDNVIAHKKNYRNRQ